MTANINATSPLEIIPAPMPIEDFVLKPDKRAPIPEPTNLVRTSNHRENNNESYLVANSIKRYS